MRGKRRREERGEGRKRWMVEVRVRMRVRNE
jgi:hypothetical protein